MNHNQEVEMRSRERDKQRYCLCILLMIIMHDDMVEKKINSIALHATKKSSISISLFRSPKSAPSAHANLFIPLQIASFYIITALVSDRILYFYL